MDSDSTFFVVVSVLAVLAGVLVWRVLHARRLHSDARRLKRSIEQETHIPATLHPVIDTGACIGSLSCIKACPEGDILGVVAGTARLIEGANCIGHGRCHAECPVDAIKLVFGTSERGIDLPEVDENFESARSGVFVVGELGGMGLIRNAISQGLEAAAFIGESGRARTGKAAVDVLIVGAGPGGIGAAIGCTQAGLRFQIIDQEVKGGTVAHYPRQKIVMSEPVRIPGYGVFGKRWMSKEDLLAGFDVLLKHFRIRVEEGERVVGIEGSPGEFLVRTERHQFQAKQVILAIGRRGSPRRLGVEGEHLGKVSYRLVDPEQYEGQRVLVVGGGDSALEAAVALAEKTDAEVSISYRKPTFTRCRAANREKIDSLIAQGRVRALMSSKVHRIDPDAVTVALNERSERLPNDYILICAGGELPLAFLKQTGISLKRHTGVEAVRAPVALRSWRHRGQGHRPSAELEAARERRFHRLLFALGLAITAALAIYGYEYYQLSPLKRLKSPLHEHMRSAGDFGHGVGIVATLVMLSNFAYPIRKRWKRLKGAAPINRWLSFHVFVGLMSPTVILFHAAFQSRNAIATATFVSLLVVVSTGVVGRFIYGLVPTAQGKTVELGEMLGQVERLKGALQSRIGDHSAFAEVKRVLKAVGKGQEKALPELVLAYPLHLLKTRVVLWPLRSSFPDKSVYRQFKKDFVRLLRVQIQVEFYGGLRNFLSWWRVIHVVLAVFLVVVIALHIAVSLYLGYGWILF